MEKKNLACLLNNYHFVVPEIQREYVWGAKKYNGVLTQFLGDLNDKIGKGDANIGFLYSYQSGAEHYLIDGQQRYTTMILLLFYLSHKENMSDDFRKIMKQETTSPAFSYRVRIYTESFLNQLLSSNAFNKKQICDQKWFKDEYLKDTTILSMLDALDIIEACVRKLPNLTYSQLMENVYFWYFDVEQTSQGEELYITMNSRGEKLTDSEQIKPRLFKRISNESDKRRYGKEWDDWEEFFYNEDLRGSRPVQLINDAMNNVVRITLELKTQSEHDNIKPVEDAESITIEDIKTCMDAIIFFAQFNDDRYCEEIKRLFGDSKSDGNFFVLKALITEKLKRQTNPVEYERIYQTILNQVRRNKIKKHKDFLAFLNNYRYCNLSFYDFVLDTDSATNKNIINGHELDKVAICHKNGARAETMIWREQANHFWNGNIRQLTSWATDNGKFSLSEFERICHNFNLLFDKTANAGWTSDNIRQALVTRHLPNYPYNSWAFGYEASEWHSILHDNQLEFKRFLDLFDNADTAKRDEIIAHMKETYAEAKEDKWADFVHHDYLLAYCNKKHIQQSREQQYGIECVQNNFKQPYSVMNMHLCHYLDLHFSELKEIDKRWQYWIDHAHWNSIIEVWNNRYTYSLGILFRKDYNSQYEIIFHNSANEEEQEKWQHIAMNFGFVEHDDVMHMCIPGDVEHVFNLLKQLAVISYQQSINHDV